MAAARMGRGRGQRRNDMTLLHILTYGSCARGKGKRTEEGKKQSCTHSCCQRSLTPIQAHALPSACRAEPCLLCRQSEPSLGRYLPDSYELLHDSLADCRLQGDGLSTSNNSCTSCLGLEVTGRCIPSPMSAAICRCVRVSIFI